MRLLVTGGAGTLGLQVINHLYSSAQSIHVIDNFATSEVEALSGFPNVVLHEGTVASQEVVDNAFLNSKPTHVIHLAASYKDPSDWHEDISTNISGMANVIKASEENGVRKIVNVQTVLCYGRPEVLPIGIDAPLRPETSYAITKTAAEQFLVSCGLPFASLRLGNVISPGLAIGPIPSFYKKLKNGERVFATRSVRDFLDIQDFLALLELVLIEDSPSGVFNVSSGNGTSMEGIFELVNSYLGGNSQPEIRDPQPDDIPEIILDPSHTFQTLGWQARVQLKDSVDSCLKSYDARGVGNIYSHLKGGDIA